MAEAEPGGTNGARAPTVAVAPTPAPAQFPWLSCLLGLGGLALAAFGWGYACPRIEVLETFRFPPPGSRDLRVGAIGLDGPTEFWFAETNPALDPAEIKAHPWASLRHSGGMNDVPWSSTCDCLPGSGAPGRAILRGQMRPPSPSVYQIALEYAPDPSSWAIPQEPLPPEGLGSPTSLLILTRSSAGPRVIALVLMALGAFLGAASFLTMLFGLWLWALDSPDPPDPAAQGTPEPGAPASDTVE